MNTQTIKIWKVTLPKLRMIHALTGESMSAIVHRLVEAELVRVQEYQVRTSEPDKQEADNDR